MNAAYAAALETRLRWLEWCETEEAQRFTASNDARTASYYSRTLPQFKLALANGETFYMDEHFCRLVSHACQGTPDELRFELDWMIRPDGWLYLAEPIPVPPPVSLRAEPDLSVAPIIGALGWRYIPAGTLVQRGGPPGTDGHGPHETLRSPATQFLCFIDFERMGKRGFGAWTYFVIRDGEILGQRINDFETSTKLGEPGAEYGDAWVDELPGRAHEIRWIYAAMHLMAQRLTVRVQHDTDRHIRRRMERPTRPAPPFITVVTLRRLEAARPKGPSVPRDWAWQWEVRGHWRNAWYWTQGVHKPVFIDAYVKGPADKPFKEAGTKLFVARR